MENPLPFNAETMTVSDLLKAANDLRDLFDAAERQVDGEDCLTHEIRDLKEHWKKRMRATNR